MVPARVSFWAICVLRVALATVYFQEEFLDGERWRNRWVQSTNDSQFGHFRVSSGKFYGHKEKDKGLQTTQNSRFYAISASFKPFSNKGKTLVIQYTVKHEQKIDCGGGYIKVFPSDLDQKNLNGKSQYYIMFGPDICGFDIKKVHVILHFKNQYHENKKSIRCKLRLHGSKKISSIKTSIWSCSSCGKAATGKLHKNPACTTLWVPARSPFQLVDGFTHLYTLILRPDLSYEVKVDGQSIESGSIEYDWNLTSLKKTEKTSLESGNWDQVEGNKAQDWEKHFLDAGASKPSDWNSELDGDWLQKPPYEDGLKAEGIDKDVWLHQKMRPTGYLTQYDLSEFENIGAIGLELWQVRSGTIFDNFLITDDEEYAEKFGKATWGETKGPEKEMDAIQAKEEVKKAREEDEEDLLMGKFHRHNHFSRFHRQGEL